MLEYGVNNVRGSMFCGTHEFHMGDAPTLTKFVDHYNDLNYRKLSARTHSTFPPFRTSWDNVQRGKCYRCGKKGRITANCHTIKHMSKRDDIKVFAMET